MNWVVLLAALEAWIASLVDDKTGRVPNPLTMSLLALNLTLAVSLADDLTQVAAIGAITAAAFAFSLALFRIGFGGGDAKLVLALAPLLGPLLGVAVVISCLSALSRRSGTFSSAYLALSLLCLAFWL